MSSKRIHRAVLGAIAGVVLLAGGAEASERLDWLEDYPLAMEEAILTRRPVLVTFYTDWCGWCRKLEMTTLRDPQVTEIARHLVTVRVNGEEEPGLAQLFRVQGYPTTVLLSRRGRELGRVRGYHPPETFRGAMFTGLSRREPLREVAEAAEAAPGDPEALYAYGDVLLALGEYQQAREVLGRVAGADPDDGSHLQDDADLDIALTYLFNLQFEASLPRFEHYLATYPDSERRVEGQFFHGVALWRSGQRERGLDLVEEAAAATNLEYIKYEAQRLRELDTTGE